MNCQCSWSRYLSWKLCNSVWMLWKSIRLNPINVFLLLLIITLMQASISCHLILPKNCAMGFHLHGPCKCGWYNLSDSVTPLCFVLVLNFSQMLLFVTKGSAFATMTFNYYILWDIHILYCKYYVTVDDCSAYCSAVHFIKKKKKNQKVLLLVYETGFVEATVMCSFQNKLSKNMWKQKLPNSRQPPNLWIISVLIFIL